MGGTVDSSNLRKSTEQCNLMIIHITVAWCVLELVLGIVFSNALLISARILLKLTKTNCSATPHLSNQGYKIHLVG